MHALQPLRTQHRTQQEEIQQQNNNKYAEACLFVNIPVRVFHR